RQPPGNARSAGRDAPEGWRAARVGRAGRRCGGHIRPGAPGRPPGRGSGRGADQLTRVSPATESVAPVPVASEPRTTNANDMLSKSPPSVSPLIEIAGVYKQYGTGVVAVRDM